ncbi:hypothetical protein N7490_004396 [Penicillium lividum]|nr:hypothetical protein N7490_004396 [Penicillium lividum]
MPNSICKEADEAQADHSYEEFCGTTVSLSNHRKLKWKLDLVILPLISSVYFFASMGRSDLANAQVAGLSEDLRLSPQDYSNAATVLFVGYVVLQLPGTLLLKQIGPAKQFAGAMIIVLYEDAFSFFIC